MLGLGLEVPTVKTVLEKPPGRHHAGDHHVIFPCLQAAQKQMAPFFGGVPEEAVGIHLGAREHKNHASLTPESLMRVWGEISRMGGL